MSACHIDRDVVAIRRRSVVKHAFQKASKSINLNCLYTSQSVSHEHACNETYFESYRYPVWLKPRHLTAANLALVLRNIPHSIREWILYMYALRTTHSSSVKLLYSNSRKYAGTFPLRMGSLRSFILLEYLTRKKFHTKSFNSLRFILTLLLCYRKIRIYKRV